MNEEEIKNRLIVPFLESIGYKAELLSFEKNFKIRLGKNTIRIKNEYCSGRSDILVYLDKKPFMMWETKREGHKIMTEDIDQAISYSRLTESITPFTIISNAQETHIYNTLTKEKIEKDDINQDLISPSIEESLRLKSEALKNIICYSNENLIEFTNGICNREIERLKDNKYISNLYVERKDIHAKFADFLNNDKKVFFIRGNSGTGKTNIVCNLVESNMNDNAMLFYNSCFIEKSILDTIFDDFNFVFDEQLNNKQLFNRINILSQKRKKYFIICIDAIDELTAQDPILSLDKFLNFVNNFSNVKVCLSCKESYVDYYLEQNGTSSLLKKISKEEIMVRDFNSEEKDKIISKYKKYYNVEINDSQYDELMKRTWDGFLLRSIFEVFENSEIESGIDNISVIQKYIEKKASNYNLNKCDLIKALETIGLLFMHDKDDFFITAIEEQIVNAELKKCNINISVDTLIKCDILQLMRISEINYIDFTYLTLSYYVIAILSARLNALKNESFISEVFKLNENIRCKESLLWFSKNSNKNYYVEINQFKEEYGKYLIETYRKEVNENFPNIRDKFENETDINNVGIAISSNDSFAICTYGFYKKDANNLDVSIIDFSNQQSLINLGIKRIYSSMSAINIKRIIKRRLKSIMKDRELNQNNCKNLSMERIIIDLFVYGKALSLNYKCEIKNFIPILDEFFPLNLVEIRKKILVFNIDTLKRMNIISQHEDTEVLYQKQIRGEISIPQVRIYNRTSELPIYDISNLITNYILSFHEDYIISPYLLLPLDIGEDTKTTYISDLMIESFSKEELHNYLYDILDKCIDEYLLLVENNFPTLKDSFEYYNLFKKGVNVRMYLYKKENSFHGKYLTEIYYINSGHNEKKIEIKVCSEKEMQYDKKLNDYAFHIISSLPDIFFFNYSHNQNYNYKYMVLSNLIYELIEYDLNDVLSK